MGKEDLRSIAEESYRAMSSGCYSYSGKTISFDRKKAEEVKVYSPSWDECRVVIPSGERCEVKVSAEDTVSALLSLPDTLDSLVLNFASAVNPGGGFLSGARAQEEAISRASTLYLSIGSQNASVMYSENRRNGGKFYLEYLLFSPYVFFFRNSNHDFLPNPVMTSVLSSPAPNKRRFSLSGPELEKVLEKRIFRILAVAAEEKKKDLILGAWGCGVFGNDPVAVASIFKKVIHESFANAFRNIIFAIPEGRYDNNYESFREVFS